MNKLEDKLFELFIIQLQILRSKISLIALYNYYDYTFTTDLSKFDAIKFVNVSKEIADNECDLFKAVDCDKLFEYFLQIQHSNSIGNEIDYKLSRAIESSHISLHNFLFEDMMLIKQKIMKAIIDDDVYEFHNKLCDAVWYGTGIIFEDGEYQWK